MDLECICIDLEEWEYIAEGNTKIIYASKNVADKRLSGMVLKLSKIADTKKHNLEVYSKRCFIDSSFLGEVFPRIIHPCYLPNVNYVAFNLEREKSLNLPSFIEVFHCSLHLDEILQRCHVDNPNRKELIYLSPIGILESNICHYGNNLNFFHSLSFELKVKCGFRSFSPFLQSNRYVKHSFNRFQLLQLSKTYDRVYKGKQPRWGDIHSISRYNPYQLMSTSTVDINDALQALFSNPQNNLGIRFDGKLVYGWGTESIDADDARYISDFLCADNEDSAVDSEAMYTDQRWVSASIQALGEVIESEPLFQQIKTLQALDVIDVDGCQKIYQHLIHLVGSEEIAIELIDSHVANPISSCSVQYLSEIVRIHEHYNQSNNGGKLPVLSSPSSLFGPTFSFIDSNETNQSTTSTSLDIDRLSVLLYEVQRFGLEKHFPNIDLLSVVGSTSFEPIESLGPSENIDDRLLAWIDSLCVTDCVSLLGAWLVALTASDMSVIITLKQLANYSYSRPRGHISHSKPEIPLASGIMEVDAGSFQLKPLRCRPQLEYSIGLVDFYPKPASKIQSKIRLEDEICRKATVAASIVAASTVAASTVAAPMYMCSSEEDINA